MKILLVSFLLAAAAATCEKPQNPAQEPLRGDGQIKVFLCSRGCYQYVLQVESDRWFPVNLAEEFKKDGLEVTFEGEPQEGKTMIQKPAPNDAPVDDFEARNIRITSMAKK